MATGAEDAPDVGDQSRGGDRPRGIGLGEHAPARRAARACPTRPTMISASVRGAGSCGASAKTVRCRSPGASSRALSDRHGVSVGGATTVAPARASRSVTASESATSKATRTVAGHPASDLDLVDERRHARGRRARGSRGPRPGSSPGLSAAEGRLLGQAELVPVERQRGVVVGRRHRPAAAGSPRSQCPWAVLPSRSSG